MKKLYFLILFLLIFQAGSFSQDLEDLLEEEVEERTDYTTATFKATRLVNGHSIERMQKGQLDFRIDHRFGELSSGSYEFFGLDRGFVHLSLEYGINDWLMFGIGRSAYQKTVDGFVKFSLLRQSKGKRNMPVSVSMLVSADMIGTKPATALDSIFANRLSYSHQLLIARKFNERLSLQVMPTYVHKNLVPHPDDKNDFFALGVGGRYKLTNRLSLNIEYYRLISPSVVSSAYDAYSPLSVGFDLETGGHVFQLFFSNSIWNTERGYITNTTGDWIKGNVHFGFKISRVFPLIKRKVE